MTYAHERHALLNKRLDDIRDAAIRLLAKYAEIETCTPLDADVRLWEVLAAEAALIERRARRTCLEIEDARDEHFEREELDP